MLIKYWKWYNNLKEPYRFFIAMFMVFPFIVSFSVMKMLDSPYNAISWFVLSGTTFAFLITKELYQS
jgi:hypothetical protein